MQGMNMEAPVELTVQSRIAGGSFRLGRHWPDTAVTVLVSPGDAVRLRQDGNLVVVDGTVRPVSEIEAENVVLAARIREIEAELAKLRPPPKK